VSDGHHLTIHADVLVLQNPVEKPVHPDRVSPLASSS
jgi:hypothetical protein